MEPCETTVVVLDDEAVVGELIAAGLKTRGYPVLVASRCADAEQLIRDHNGRPALLITDIIMPDMTGPELVHWLRDQGFRFPVLYISGYAEADPTKVHGACEQRHFLMKPFSAPELLQAVEDTLKTGAP